MGHASAILIIAITGDHRQVEGRRRCGRDRERLEVRGHGARPAVPDHLHRLHHARHCRPPHHRSSRHRHLESQRSEEFEKHIFPPFNLIIMAFVCWTVTKSDGLDILALQKQMIRYLRAGAFSATLPAGR